MNNDSTLKCIFPVQMTTHTKAQVSGTTEGFMIGKPPSKPTKGQELRCSWVLWFTFCPEKENHWHRMIGKPPSKPTKGQELRCSWVLWSTFCPDKENYGQDSRSKSKHSGNFRGFFDKKLTINTLSITGSIYQVRILSQMTWLSTSLPT